MTKIEAPPTGMRLLRTLPGEDAWFGRLRWSPTGRRLAAGASDRAVWVWDLESPVGQLPRRIETGDGSPIAFAWMGDESILWWPTDAPPYLRGQSVLDGADLEIELDFEGLSGATLSADCTADTRAIVALIDPRTVRIWDRRSGKLLQEWAETREAATVAWTAGGRVIVLCDHQGSCWQRDAESGDLLAGFGVGPGAWEHAAVRSPDGRFFAVGRGNAVVVFDAATGERLRRLLGHKRGIKEVAFSADTSLLASKSFDGTVRIWRCDRWQEVAVLPEATLDSTWPPGLAFHPHSAVLATLGENDSIVRIWQLNLLSSSTARRRRQEAALESSYARLAALDDDFREWVLTRLGQLSNEGAKNHVYLGLLQRILMMAVSRTQIFTETHRRANLIDPDTTANLNVHLNAYYLNLHGSLDNLAWILVHEIKLQPGLREGSREAAKFVDLFGEQLQKALAAKHPELSRWLRKLDLWRKRTKTFRHPAAHRLPLLVAPGVQTDAKREEREALTAAAEEAVRSRDFTTYWDLQYEIQSLAEYHPVFSKTEPEATELHGLAGALLADHRILFRIARKVLGPLLGDCDLRRYSATLPGRPRGRLFDV